MTVSAVAKLIPKPPALKNKYKIYNFCVQHTKHEFVFQILYIHYISSKIILLVLN